jgi:hypothetical protein
MTMTGSADAFTKFIQRMKNNGVARNSFYVKFDIFDTNFTKQLTSEKKGVWYPGDEGASDRNLFTNERLQSMNVMCNTITLPGRELATIDAIIKPGWQDRIVSNLKAPEPITAKFYCSPDLNERRFIENWMNMALNPHNYTANYYDEYAKYNTITIFCLPRRFSGSIMTEEIAIKPENGPIFFVKLFECYPTKLEDTELTNSDSEKLFELSVTFSYKYFKTVTDLNFPTITTGYDYRWEQTL